VPFFIYGLYSTLFNLIHLAIFDTVIMMLISIIVQGIGHRQGKLPPEEFTGIYNVLLMIFLEQVYTFPKFVFTGA